MIKQVKHHILRDYQSDDVWTDSYEFPTRQNQPELFDNNIAFTCLLPHPGDGMLYVLLAMGLLSVSLAAGFLYRLCATLIFVGNAYIFLIDSSTYLNSFLQ